MSILRSMNAGMGDRPIDEAYLVGNGWKKLSDDDPDKIEFGINYINLKYPNLGLIPFSFWDEKDIIDVKKLKEQNEITKQMMPEDLYWGLFVKATCGIDAQGNVIEFDAWESYSRCYFHRIADLRNFMKSRFLL